MHPYPRSIRCPEALPKTAGGKIQRFALATPTAAPDVAHVTLLLRAGGEQALAAGSHFGLELARGADRQRASQPGEGAGHLRTRVN